MTEEFQFMGQTYDLSKEGPCCREYQGRRQELLGRIRAFHSLGVDTPRRVTVLYKAMEGEIQNFYPNECPCSEAPNPVKYRKFMAKVITYRNSKDSSDKTDSTDILERLAKETFDEKLI